MDADIIVIGGGAAGMLAAISAAQQNAKVLILERNEKLGKKIYITGKGRCNITNDSEIENHLLNINNGKKFMQSAYCQFSSNDMITLLNNAGLKTKVERGNRVFPASDKSNDVIKTLEKLLIKNNVTIKYNTRVQYILKKENQYMVCDNNNKYTSSCVIVASGGMSYSSTGSTGDGYKFANDFDIKVKSPVSALCPIILENKWKDLQGLSLKNVCVHIKVDNKIIATEMGEMLFTNRGVSGPIVLSLSSKINRIKLNNAIFSIDLKPALSEMQLQERFIREFSDPKHNKKYFSNYIRSLLPASLVEVFIFSTKIPMNKKVCELTKVDRNVIIKTLKNFDSKIIKIDDIDFAIITAGGVELNEINSKTMESKKYKNLFFAGELLDIDAMTGGYNLQVAFSTGFVAGKWANKHIMEEK